MNRLSSSANYFVDSDPDRVVNASGFGANLTTIIPRPNQSVTYQSIRQSITTHPTECGWFWFECECSGVLAGGEGPFPLSLPKSIRRCGVLDWRRKDAPIKTWTMQWSKTERIRHTGQIPADWIHDNDRSEGCWIEHRLSSWEAAAPIYPDHHPSCLFRDSFDFESSGEFPEWKEWSWRKNSEECRPLLCISNPWRAEERRGGERRVE